MFDVHCHLLPGLDDGPETPEQSLALLRAAMLDGITHIIVTPHIHLGRWENDIASIGKAFQRLARHLPRQKMLQRITIAAEVRLDAEMLPLVAARRGPFLGRMDGYDVLLLEMPHGRILPGTEKMLRWLKQRGVLPMIAHPERNRAILKQPSRLQSLVDEGCLFQVTAGALVGQFGERAEQVARQMLERDLITVLASDAHNTRNRPPNLSAGYHRAKALVGEQKARQLVYTRPRALFESNQFFQLAQGSLSLAAG